MTQAFWVCEYSNCGTGGIVEPFARPGARYCACGQSSSKCCSLQYSQPRLSVFASFHVFWCPLGPLPLKYGFVFALFVLLVPSGLSGKGWLNFEGHALL